MTEQLGRSTDCSTRGDTMTDLDRLLDLAEKATPGPWSGSGSHVGGPDYAIAEVLTGAIAVARMGTAPDAAYIAAASPDVIRALVHRLRAAEAVVEAARRMDEARSRPPVLTIYDSLTAALRAYDEVVQ